MGSYRQIIYQVVFLTYGREARLAMDHPQDLYAYIGGILKEKKCHPYAINGMTDHIHLLFSLHPDITLSGLVKDIKLATSKWMKARGIAPLFDRWSPGYGAFTYSSRDLDILIAYVQNQEAHHKKESFQDEFRRLLKEHDVPFDEQYLFD